MSLRTFLPFGYRLDLKTFFWHLFGCVFEAWICKVKFWTRYCIMKTLTLCASTVPDNQNKNGRRQDCVCAGMTPSPYLSDILPFTSPRSLVIIYQPIVHPPKKCLMLSSSWLFVFTALYLVVFVALCKWRSC